MRQALILGRITRVRPHMILLSLSMSSPLFYLIFWLSRVVLSFFGAGLFCVQRCEKVCNVLYAILCMHNLKSCARIAMSTHFPTHAQTLTILNIFLVFHTLPSLDIIAHLRLFPCIHLVSFPFRSNPV